MILVDTSVWIDYLRDLDNALGDLLNEGQVISHPAVIGELACGTFTDRRQILAMLHELPQIMEVHHHEVLTMIEQHKLMGRGLSWIDMHLLASCLLGEIRLWTLDKRLAAAASQLSVPDH